MANYIGKNSGKSRAADDDDIAASTKTNNTLNGSSGLAIGHQVQSDYSSIKLYKKRKDGKNKLRKRKGDRPSMRSKLAGINRRS